MQDKRTPLTIQALSSKAVVAKKDSGGNAPPHVLANRIAALPPSGGSGVSNSLQEAPRAEPSDTIAPPANPGRRLTPVEIRQASQTGSLALLSLPRNLLGLQAWSSTALKPEASETSIPKAKAEAELPPIALPYYGSRIFSSRASPDPILQWQPGALQTSLSPDRIACLLRSPDLARPCLLSPLLPLQRQPPSLSLSAETQAFEDLTQARLWEPETHTLTPQGRCLFLPLFAPTSRLLLLSSAPHAPSLTCFLGWRRWFCYAEETDALRLSAPFLERDIFSWLRRKFPLPSASASTLYRVSLTEDQWIFLIASVESGLLNGPVSERSVFSLLRTFLSQDARSWPALGTLGPDAFFRTSFQQASALQSCLETLIREKILATTGHSGIFTLHPRFSAFLPRIFHSTETVFLREDQASLLPGDPALSSSEFSLFVSDGSLVLSRIQWQDDPGRYLVHLEEPSWSDHLQRLRSIAEPQTSVSDALLSDTRSKIRLASRIFR